jgi:hypothetical protein
MEETSWKIDEKLNQLLVKYLLKLPIKNRPYFRKRRKEFFRKKIQNVSKPLVSDQAKEKLPIEVLDSWVSYDFLCCIIFEAIVQ